MPCLSAYNTIDRYLVFGKNNDCIGSTKKHLPLRAGVECIRDDFITRSKRTMPQ